MMKLPVVIDFLTELKTNNNREWFLENKKKYELARKAAEDFIAKIISEIRKTDESIPALTPKECFFRINRDVRFSKDKSPYKTNFGAFISRGNRKGPYAGYYIHMEPSGCFLAGGIYMPLPNALKAIRDEIYFNFPEFQKILINPDFKKYFGTLTGDALVNVPKAYPANHPAADYLKLKNFAVIHYFDEKLLESSDFINYSVNILVKIKPLNAFLNRAVDNFEEN